MKKVSEWTVFVVALLLKAFDGLLEFIGGLLLFFFKPSTINSLVVLLTQHELSEDPHDFIATNLVRIANDLSLSSVHFASLYLLFHGVIKVSLVIFLLKKRLWAYPIFMVFLSVFIIYQIYRVSYNHSIFLFLLTILDAIIVWLVFKEYQKLRHKLLID